MKKFWTCYVEGTNGGKHKRHYDIEEAAHEAERLARKEGKNVYLFLCIGVCYAEERPITWEVIKS